MLRLKLRDSVEESIKREKKNDLWLFAIQTDKQQKLVVGNKL